MEQQTLPQLSDKELYSQWCETQPDMPVFMQPWWLDAVCAGKQWDVMLYTNSRTGAVLAALPYQTSKRWRIRFVIMPKMTQIAGIWFDKSLRNDDGTIWDKEIEKSVCEDFIKRIDELGLWYYYQQFPLYSSCVSYFQNSGFKVKKRVTYRIDDLADLDAVIDRFSKNKKRQLQKALSLHTERSMTAEDFYRFHTECLTAQKKKITYSREFLLVLDRKTSRLNQSRIISIHNADGEVCAAAYVVWDKQTLYYLIPCYSPKYKESGAGALLALECIKLAREKGLQFDFEGSMIKGVANHYKQFGSTPVTYFSIHKYYKRLFALALFYNWLKQKL